MGINLKPPEKVRPSIHCYPLNPLAITPPPIYIYGMGFEGTQDVSADPSREELRQVIKSKPTGEFSSPVIAEQVAKKVKDDARLAEVRTELGLEPELSDRRGLGNERRVAEGDTTRGNSLGMAVRAPRTEYAFREADRVSQLEGLRGKIDWARSIGATIPNFEFPDRDDENFRESYSEIVRVMANAIGERYTKFGLSLPSDPEMSVLIGKFRDAQRTVKEATAGSFGVLNDTKYAGYTQGTFERMFNKTRLIFGGNAIVERGQAAYKNEDYIEKQIVALMCKKFDDAGLNKTGPDSYGINFTVTPSSSNRLRAEEVMGISLQ